mgnify:CR=1 FL=1
MEWVYDTCVEYAHNFGKKPANLLLFGRPGLGKTHLSAAIAREVSGKGFSVVYDTAGHIFERFEAQKFGRDEAERDVERVLKCDLLILDEAGSAWELDMVDKALLQKAVLERPAEQECVLTAHAAPQWMLDAADYSTEMKCRRHPYQKGIKARKGIEY